MPQEQVGELVHTIQTAIADLMPLIPAMAGDDEEALQQARCDLERLLQKRRFPILQERK